MSGAACQRNQGGTVEYIIMYMYPTPDYVRGGIFILAASESTFPVDSSPFFSALPFETL